MLFLKKTTHEADPAPNSPWNDLHNSGAEDPFTGDIFACNEGERHERWSVSWADLMMTMFVFFVILYVHQARIKEMSVSMGSAGSQISDGDSSRIMASESSDLKDSAISGKKGSGKKSHVVKDEFVDETTELSLNEQRTVGISMAGDILFDPGDATLKPRTRWRLDQIAAFLKDNSFIVNVVGHTDDTQDISEKFPTGWELSTARASAVVRYLIEEKGVDEFRFFVSGYSSLQSVYTKASETSSATNRRVEIILLKELPHIKNSSMIPERNTTEKKSNTVKITGDSNG
ncbi:MotB3 [Desulfamplus magnetovallimortis]|uniref:MotB3 n=1 Tax=Desulfamplus magnetovallimortis TaxID=1246637 RepID=A0A1W1HAQ0_9BACT|nr:OmpA family protein [Desulfamplus magnetovallimortis]SLM29509.1 MotB3 [Desulfamplus magnetovallimortis]